MNLDFIAPITKSIEVMSTASKINKLAELIKSMVYAIAVSVIFINVINLIRK